MNPDIPRVGPAFGRAVALARPDGSRFYVAERVKELTGGKQTGSEWRLAGLTRRKPGAPLRLRTPALAQLLTQKRRALQ